MKSWNLRRPIYAVLTGVALAMVAPAGVAASDAASGTQVASLAGRAEMAQAPTAAAPFTLYLEDASGNAFRLVRIEGSGWKYADGWKAVDSRATSMLQEVNYEPSKRERPAEEMSDVGEPLTVFIDGPSGFTFVYNQEGGWKFVGKLIERRE
jgi:hypothetical protein